MTIDSLRKQPGNFSRLLGILPWPGIGVIIAALLFGLLIAWLPLRNVGAVVFGLTVTILIIIQPLFGLALTLLVGPFGALEQLWSGIISLDSGQVLLVLTFFSWIGHRLARKRFEISNTPITVPLLLFVFVGFVSLLDTPSITTGMKELLKWLEIAIIMLLVVDLGKEDVQGPERGNGRSLLGGPPRTVWIVGMLLLAGVSQAVIGIWQFGMRGDGPEHFLVLDRFYRAYGTYEQPNPFGGFMNLSVLLAIGISIGLITAWGYWIRNRDEKKLVNINSSPSWRTLFITALMLLIVAVTGSALIFSWSRGAWLGFGAGLATMVFFYPRNRILGFLIIGLSIFVIGLAYVGGLLPEVITERLTSFTDDFKVGDVRGEDINDENYSVLERQAHWQAGLDMLRDDVLLGVGFGNYADAYEDYSLINWPDALGHAHNYYINLLAEVGIVGLLAYLIFWTVVVWQTIRLLNVLLWPDRGIVLGLLAVWIALATHHLVDKLYVNNIYIHLGVLLGLLQLIELNAVKVREEKID